ncbi:iron-sulfur cluster carrier protein ApbC [Pseudomaricurvus alcaniphilus]|uniref:iron-sulfur cluster carrier protein ApbC n=1 Tax=Pseudomaricurvus alcaniphilus TaxID=1166482 RepID=UPI001FB737E4|nr:iron-sulfur cluster carrier protein ApbC [Pseudomaricurvus alcaniphilus]
MTDNNMQLTLESRLLPLRLPDSEVALGDVGRIARFEHKGAELTVFVTLAIPARGLQEQLAEAIWQALNDLDGIDKVIVDIGWEVAAAKVVDQAMAVPKVRNIIAVASGKGGVGKSTTAVNLALALAAEGARVGILDADIYGPSVPTMLGVAEQRPNIIDNKFMQPVPAHGICSISMGYMVNEKTPMVWRGPMASGALQQLLRQTAWPELDYLVIDMPPGTGDIQLTLSQSVPVTGSIVVTTPQDIALLDAKKGIEMFRKVNVPVLGVVENMATHICSNCGHEEHIFGSGGGERIARDYDTRLLGALPLALTIREQADGGKPSVAADPESDISLVYRQIARRLAIALHLANQQASVPSIEISDD